MLLDLEQEISTKIQGDNAMLTRQQQLEIVYRLWEEGSYASELYISMLRDAGLEGLKLDSEEKFHQLPFMTREDIRRSTHEQRMVCSREDVLGYFTSSGTTGIRKVYAFSKEDKKVQEYVTRKVYTPLGIGPGDIGLIAVPIGSGNMGHSMTWQYMVMGGGFYCVDEPSLDNIRYALQTMPITTISTLPSLAMEMGKSEEDREIAGKSSVKRLLVGGDVMSRVRRMQIENLYQAKCYDSFGMSEIFGPTGNECLMQDGIHFCDDVLLIEVIDPDTLQEVAPGETGLACYTMLWKKGSPLIRYLTDDLISISTEPCKCGSDLPRLWYKGRLDFTRRNTFGAIISPCDIEAELFKATGYASPYSVGIHDDGTYVLHLVEGVPGSERSDSALLADALEKLMGGKVTTAFDHSSDYEYKNHCFRKE